MSDFLNPPLPPGGITDNTINYDALNNPPTSSDGLPPLPDLSTLPGLNSGLAAGVAGAAIANALSNTVSPATTPTQPAATSDGFVAKIAYLGLGVVIIAGAIWTYRK